MKIVLLSILLLSASVPAATSAALPDCTSENEGETLLLEDGFGPAQVYVCQDGEWIPASSR